MDLVAWNIKTEQNNQLNYYFTINKLREKVEKSKQNYNKVYREYIENQKKKTEAQQLIQKCIEDVQIQLNVANTKLKEQQSNISAPTNVNNETVDYNEMIKILERKLRKGKIGERKIGKRKKRKGRKRKRRKGKKGKGRKGKTGKRKIRQRKKR